MTYKEAKERLEGMLDDREIPQVDRDAIRVVLTVLAVNARHREQVAAWAHDHLTQTGTLKTPREPVWPDVYEVDETTGEIRSRS